MKLLKNHYAAEGALRQQDAFGGVIGPRGESEVAPWVYPILAGCSAALLTLGVIATFGDGTSIDNHRLAGRLKDPGSWPAASPSVVWVDTPKAKLRVRLEHSPSSSQSARSRPAVVFLMDPPIVVEHYDVHFQKLTREDSVVSAVAAMELPGFGFSFPKRSFGWRMEDTTEAISAALQQLFPESEYPAGIVLVAPCGAAYSAIIIAAEENMRSRIAKLVLAQAPSLEQERVWAKCMEPRSIILRQPYLRQVANVVSARAMSKGWIETVTGERAIVPHLTAIADSALANGGCFCLASILHRTFSTNTPMLSLQPVTQPTLFLWGQRDRSHRRSTPRSGMEAYAPHATFVLFSDVGHFPDLEHVDRFLELLEKFIGGSVDEIRPLQAKI